MGNEYLARKLADAKAAQEISNITGESIESLLKGAAESERQRSQPEVEEPTVQYGLLELPQESTFSGGQWYTAREASKLLNVSERNVYPFLIAEGYLIINSNGSRIITQKGMGHLSKSAFIKGLSGESNGTLKLDKFLLDQLKDYSTRG